MFNQQRQMTAPLKLPVSDEDCVELERIGDGGAPKAVKEFPSGEMEGSELSSGSPRLNTISDQQPDKLSTNSTSDGSHRDRDWGGSSSSMGSDKFKSSSSDSGDDCAALLLACLHCRFLELMALLPDTCERAVSRCFPSYKHILASGERDQQAAECCSFKLELDCSCCGSCQDTAELIELAMEISEVCYR